VIVQRTPERSDAIRVRDCESTLSLRRVGEDATAVDYRISLDPGGDIPKWLVRWSSERLPVDTLIALEKQVRRTQGQYRSAVQFWSQAR
jgi:hypothetical protein